MNRIRSPRFTIRKKSGNRNPKTLVARLWFRLRISAFARSAAFGFRIFVPLLLAGCAAGPNFEAPAPPQVNGYTSSPLSTTGGTTNVAGGEPQHFLEGGDISEEWWKLFHSKPLNALIERSLKNNPSLK